MAYLVANKSEGKLKFKKLQQSCITSLLTVLNNFIKNRLTAKSNALPAFPLFLFYETTTVLPLFLLGVLNDTDNDDDEVATY